MTAIEFPEGRSWREFYQAAVLELDSSKLSGRITEAEKIIVRRARELFFQNRDDSLQEQQSPDDALHTLSALRSIIKREAA
jgi:hypothetical protein